MDTCHIRQNILTYFLPLVIMNITNSTHTHTHKYRLYIFVVYVYTNKINAALHMGMFIYTFKPNRKEYHKISQKTVCIDTLLTRKITGFFSPDGRGRLSKA